LISIEQHGIIARWLVIQLITESDDDELIEKDRDMCIAAHRDWV
jgi:hypothetical protein